MDAGVDQAGVINLMGDLNWMVRVECAHNLMTTWLQLAIEVEKLRLVELTLNGILEGRPMGREQGDGMPSVLL